MAVGAGIGVAVAHSKGNLEVLVERSRTEVMNAIEETFRDLKMSLVSLETLDQKTAIVGRTPEKRIAKVEVKDRGETVTKLSIRVGTFGKKTTTHTVYAETLEKFEDETVARAGS
jgi:hypothetical protein